MSLEYYQNDYIPANGSTGTYTGSANYVGSYTGNITAWRWKNRVGNTNVDGHWGYEYLYNDRNELMTAQFGNIHGNYSGTNPTFWTNLTDNYKVSGINYDKNGNITALQRTDGNGSFMDRLAYQYYNGTNKLSKIQDLVATASNGDIANQGNNNYTYSQIGELIQDNSENNKIIYDVYGKVTEVKTIANVTKAKYYYDGSGQRIKKETYNGTTVKTTWYIAGHIYERVGTNGELLHTEITISAAGRLGVAYTNVYNNALDYHYELSDHLGNVRAVIRKAAPGSSNPIDILSYADYFPFGWQMPGRNQQGDYRYAYQGQEKDPETGWEAFELRMYDGRVGRWMTMDPYSQYHSPYLAMGNRPISGIDPDGGKFFDWVEVGGSMIYDSGIKSQADANAKYGIGAKHHEVGTTYMSGGEEIMLGTLGTFTVDGVFYKSVDHANLSPVAMAGLNIDPATLLMRGSTLGGIGMIGAEMYASLGTYKGGESSLYGHMKKYPRATWNTTFTRGGKTYGFMKDPILVYKLREAGKFKSVGMYNAASRYIWWANASKALGVAGIGLTAIDIYGKHSAGTATTVDYTFAGLDAVMTGVGMMGGPVGWGISGVYFISRLGVEMYYGDMNKAAEAWGF